MKILNFNLKKKSLLVTSLTINKFKLKNYDKLKEKKKKKKPHRLVTIN